MKACGLEPSQAAIIIFIIPVFAFLCIQRLAIRSRQVGFDSRLISQGLDADLSGGRIGDFPAGARAEDDGDSRSDCHLFQCQFVAGHVGHRQICDYQIEFVRFGTESSKASTLLVRKVTRYPNSSKSWLPNFAMGNSSSMNRMLSVPEGGFSFSYGR